MFFLDPTGKLYSAVVYLLAENPNITVGDLHKRLQRREKVTLTHLYRIINRMLDEQMILKKGTRLMINSMWLGHLELFAKNALGNLQEISTDNAVSSIEEGKHLIIKADTLAHMQGLWYDLLVQMHIEAPPEERGMVYKYYSHAWWVIRGGKENETFYKRIAEQNIKCYWVYGNDTPLDIEAVKQYKDVFDSKVVDRSTFPTEGYCLNVHGDYILECIFPNNIARHFALLFDGITKPDDLDKSLIEDIFQMKAEYKIKVWRNAKMAAQFKAKIKRFF